MSNTPIVSWYEGTNETANQVVSTINYGTVDADSASAIKVFHIWNNRGGTTDVPKMEEVVFTTRDRQGGLGDTVGNIVEAVKDNWFYVRNDSLGETNFTPVGKGGIPANATGVHPIGTNGITTNINASSAVTWSASANLALNTYIQPTAPNGMIYKVTQAGISDTVQPSWTTSEGAEVIDGSVKYIAIPIDKSPSTQEILGLANNTLPDGTNANDAGGNFVTLSVYAEVPITASAGKNLLVQRCSYRYV